MTQNPKYKTKEKIRVGTTIKDAEEGSGEITVVSGMGKGTTYCFQWFKQGVFETGVFD